MRKFICTTLCNEEYVGNHKWYSSEQKASNIKEALKEHVQTKAAKRLMPDRLTPPEFFDKDANPPIDEAASAVYVMDELGDYAWEHIAVEVK
jgi:hypothetical protein